ncbi:MAG: radical SAM protein, partial [Elusimicrobia bacterium]|nr:radical SAM protein [Elusimicrobiota bacterium]
GRGVSAEPEHAADEPRRWVRLTRVCNQRCVFCLDRDAQDGGVRPLGEVLAELAEGRRRGARRAVLSGGEPTLHPSFLEAVAEAKRAGYGHVQTVTNGRRFCYPAFAAAAKAAGLDEATFSIHGPDAASHDALTRSPGSFVQALAGLRNARAAGLIVNADVVLTRPVLPRLRETLEVLGAQGVREFDLLALTPFGDAWRNWKELACDPGDGRQRTWLHGALELARRPGWRVWTNRLDPRWLAGREELLQDPRKLVDEAVGRERDLGPLLLEGREPFCAGERCPHCWLRGLCADARALRRLGRLRGLPVPACHGGGEGRVLKRTGTGLAELARFHAAHRRPAPAARCRRCALRSACSGLPGWAWSA